MAQLRRQVPIGGYRGTPQWPGMPGSLEQYGPPVPYGPFLSQWRKPTPSGSGAGLGAPVSEGTSPTDSYSIDPNVKSVIAKILARVEANLSGPQRDPDEVGQAYFDAHNPQIEQLQRLIASYPQQARNAAMPVMNDLNSRLGSNTADTNTAYAGAKNELIRHYNQLPASVRAQYAPQIAAILRDQQNLSGDIAAQYKPAEEQLQRQLAQQSLQATQNQSNLTDWFNQAQGTAKAGAARAATANQAAQTGLANANQGLVNSLGGNGVGAELSNWATLGNNAMAANTQTQNNFAANLQSIIGLSGTSARTDEANRQSQIQAGLFGQQNDLQGRRAQDQAVSARTLAAALTDTRNKRASDITSGQNDIRGNQAELSSLIGSAILGNRNSLRSEIAKLKGATESDILKFGTEAENSLADTMTAQIQARQKGIFDTETSNTSKNAAASNLLVSTALLPYQLSSAEADADYRQRIASGASSNPTDPSAQGAERMKFIGALKATPGIFSDKGPAGLIMPPAQAISKIVEKLETSKWPMPTKTDGTTYPNWNEWVIDNVIGADKISRWNSYHPRKQYQPDKYKPTAAILAASMKKLGIKPDGKGGYTGGTEASGPGGGGGVLRAIAKYGLTSGVRDLYK